MTKPLDDVTVIEVASYVAAPSAGAILADLGADVIRVEPLRGDPWRGQARRPKVDEDLRNYDYQFAVSNRGKRSVTIDLTSEGGLATMQKLVANAQVFMCNMLAPRQAKMGLDPASLHAVNPTLVHATLTGYGTTGPEAWRPGYDVTAFFARSGLMESTREGSDATPTMPRNGQGDQTTGLAFFGAIMAALRQAERTGEGQVVETSLLETAVWTLGCDYSITAVDEAFVRLRTRHEAIIATNNRFPCGDGKWMVITMPGEANYPKLCRVIGREDLIDHEDYATARDRLRNMAALTKELDETLATKSRWQWGELFDAEGIVWAPIQALDDVVRDPQAQAIGVFCDIPDTEVGTIRSVRIPMRFHTADVGPLGPPPAAGEHTDEVLQQLGLDTDDIAQLRRDNVIGDAR